MVWLLVWYWFVGCILVVVCDLIDVFGLLFLYNVCIVLLSLPAVWCLLTDTCYCGFRLVCFV